MHKTYLATLLIFVASIQLYGQTVSPQVIASAGAFYNGNNFSVAYTSGEVIISTFTSSNYIITQGFHQPFSYKVGNKKNKINLTAKIFPNPVDNTLKVQLKLPLSKQCHLVLIDSRGRKVYKKQTYLHAGSMQTTNINMSNFQNGIYLLNISINNFKGRYTYKIVKQ